MECCLEWNVEIATAPMHAGKGDIANHLQMVDFCVGNPVLEVGQMLLIGQYFESLFVHSDSNIEGLAFRERI